LCLDELRYEASLDPPLTVQVREEFWPLCASMAADYAPDGIRVNAIVPATMDTPMNAKEFSEPGARDKYILRIPARRLGVANDIGGMATFLASEEASFCIGGLYFVNDGAELG